MTALGKNGRPGKRHCITFMLGITRWHVFKVPAAILCIVGQRGSASFRVRHRTNVVMWTIANFVALEPFSSEHCVSRALECRRP
jgi:hypothetical protein